MLRQKVEGEGGEGGGGGLKRIPKPDCQRCKELERLVQCFLIAIMRHPSGNASQ